MRPSTLAFVLMACTRQPPPPAAPAPEAEPTVDEHAEARSRVEAIRAEVEGRRAAFDETGPARPEDPEWVAARLAHLVDVDQYLRRSAYGGDLPEGEQAWFHDEILPFFQAADAANTAELTALVDRYGWITVDPFGEQASKDAWLLAQHADQDPAFQRRVLELMAPLVPEGQVSGKNYAYLLDRVAVHAEEPQTYGTQGGCEDGAWVPFALVDPEQVDARRAEVGLVPLEEYRGWFDCKGLLDRADAAYAAKDWAGCLEALSEFAVDARGFMAADAHYNAACCAALGGQTDTAFAELSAALEAGYDDAEHLAKDPDLERLRSDPRWEPLVSGVGTE